ncbi:glycoside hydrolase family 2 protein [Parafilimonas terrae]|uniref:Glycosyl hydrolases family 2, TIM barrel domain n=1 Tax=Parafilimonas terrae TaxID=1465490 RepID=A0A1I5TN85_9BACT|nr:sugar-binding domain-containing protein [Parafilimonas terrae]SFP84542.1 Glycosyl hydrolases family 2, TIM barrel domain [Parafilimonas terrae]
MILRPGNKYDNTVLNVKKWLLCCVMLLACITAFASGHNETRKYISLNENWKRASGKDSSFSFTNAEKKNFDDKDWHTVNVPDNVNTYEGVQRLKHNDFHGDAWYRKIFSCAVEKGKRYFLFFEGVGSYATVWLNEKLVGKHAGGRTSFTLDITDFVKNGNENLLTVKASQPAFIQDLPWVCGGCSDEVGFSEGSQPTGIFRPVTLIVTNQIKVMPFGVHIWNDSTANEKSASLFIDTEIKNFKQQQQTVTVQQQLKDAANKIVFTVEQSINIPAGSGITVHQTIKNVKNVTLWNLQNPYLYHVVTTISQHNNIVDAVSNDFGIRTISWPNAARKQFLLNGQPVFINGTAEYEHLLGKSHAFSSEEIKARIAQVKAAGFNAFRDAHQPHNLLYGKLINKNGLLWWPQFAAHIWFDTPVFWNNFIRLLKDWIKERRNDPSVILWGLENESTLPEDFARQCSGIIRSLDPTASSQRKITTCNGGTGADWNVPQNWSGTYGGDTAKYGEELKQEILVGEYGAWRSIGAHAETDTAKGIKLTENYMCSLLETKLRLAESVKDEVAGHYNWLLYSHDNPGRVQSGESMRDIAALAR